MGSVEEQLAIVECMGSVEEQVLFVDCMVGREQEHRASSGLFDSYGHGFGEPMNAALSTQMNVRDVFLMN